MMYHYACVYIYIFIYLFIYIFIFIYLFIYLFICISLYIYTYDIPRYMQYVQLSSSPHDSGIFASMLVCLKFGIIHLIYVLTKMSSWGYSGHSSDKCRFYICYAIFLQIQLLSHDHNIPPSRLLL